MSNLLEFSTAGDARLDKLHKARAGLLNNRDLRSGSKRIDIGTTGDRGLSSDDSHPTDTGDTSGPANSWLDHLDHRYVIPLTRIAEHRRTGRVAGDHQELDALIDEMIHHIEGERPHLGNRTRTIWPTCGVPNV